MEPPSPDEAPPGPHVRGYTLLARFDFLKRTHGAEGIAVIMAALPDGERDRLAGVEGLRWYPFLSLIHLDEAIAATFGAGDPRIFEGLGEASARRRTAWLAPDAHLINVHTFLARLAEEHGTFYNFGRLDYRRRGFTEGELSSSGFPELYPIFCRSAQGFLHGAVAELSGGPVEVEERACQCRGDPACVFALRWRRAGGRGPAPI